MMQHVQGPRTDSLGHVCSCLHPASWTLPRSLSSSLAQTHATLSWASVREVHVLLPPQVQPLRLGMAVAILLGLAVPNLGGALATWSRYPVHSCIKVAIPWNHSFPEDWGQEPRERGGSFMLSTGALIFTWHWVPQIL